MRNDKSNDGLFARNSSSMKSVVMSIALLGGGAAVDLIFILNRLREDDEQPVPAANQGNMASPIIPTAPTTPTGVVSPAPILFSPSPIPKR